MSKANPFAAYQSSGQRDREELLRAYLGSLRKGRVRFDHVTGLADMAAEFLSERQGKPCNRATLLRNLRYKKLLLSYLADRTPRGTNSISHRTIRDPAARALVETAELTAENFRRENERLRAYIAELQGMQGRDAKSAAKGPRTAARSAKAAGLTPDRLNYLQTCQALDAVLQRFDSIVSVDIQAEQIVDATASPPGPLVPASISKAFFAWLRMHPRTPAD